MARPIDIKFVGPPTVPSGARTGIAAGLAGIEAFVKLWDAPSASRQRNTANWVSGSVLVVSRMKGAWEGQRRGGGPAPGEPVPHRGRQGGSRLALLFGRRTGGFADLGLEGCRRCRGGENVEAGPQTFRAMGRRKRSRAQKLRESHPSLRPDMGIPGGPRWPGSGVYRGRGGDPERASRSTEIFSATRSLALAEVLNAG